MEGGLKHIMTFKLKHDYFSNGLFSNTEIVPTPSSLRAFINFGMIFKPFQGGFHLLIKDATLLSSGFSDDPFVFSLQCKDGNYFVYTDLGDVDLSLEMFYFSNYSISDQQGEELSQNSVISEADKIWRNVNSFELKEKGNVQFLDVMDEPYSELEIRYSAGAVVSANGVSGFVSARSGPEEVGRSYLSSHRSFQKPLAVIEIFGDSLLQRYNQVGKADYSLTFKCRASIWKYFLSHSKWNSAESLKIIEKAQGRKLEFIPQDEQLSPSNKEEEESINFNQGEMEVKSDGSRYFTFVSDKAIAYREKYQSIYQLVSMTEESKGKHKINKVLITDLKKAPHNNLFTLEGQSKKTIAHIYI